MPTTRPNIILINTDQQRYDTIGAFGFPYMETTNLDRLVAEGVSFSNNFITSASCAPVRASLFTGCYPHTTGIYKNMDVWRHSWVEDLAAAGYHCVNIGKMHTYPFETPLGFHERFVVENKDRFTEGRYFFDRWSMFLHARGLERPQRVLYRRRPDYRESLGAFRWDLPEDTHSDFFVGDLAAWWLRNKPLDKPLFLEIGFPGPHPPYDPVPRWLDRYLDKDLPLPEVTGEEIRRQPEAQRKLREHHVGWDADAIVWQESPEPESLRRMRAHYLANVSMIDEKIGEIMQALEDAGLIDNSVVIFTSDHGDCLGDHGQIQKWTMYDIVTRTPLVFWAPQLFEGGRTIGDLVQIFDIAPTLFELADVPAPSWWEAESLLPVLMPGRSRSLSGAGNPPVGRAFSGREYVFAEQSRDGNLKGTDMMTMVRSRSWKLVHYLGDDYGELYDLERDPGERRNLWNEPRHVDKKHELLRVLLDWRIKSGLRTAERSVPWR